MYNFTLFGEKVKSPLYSLGLKNILKNLLKSILSTGMLMLFLFNANNLQAQCDIDVPGTVQRCSGNTDFVLPPITGTTLETFMFYSNSFDGSGTLWSPGHTLTDADAGAIWIVGDSDNGVFPFTCFAGPFIYAVVPAGTGICIDGNPIDWPSVLDDATND